MSLKKVSRIFVMAAFFQVACASSFVPGGGVTPDPSLSTVTSNIVATVGSVNEMVLTDQTDFDKALADDMTTIVREALGFDTGDSVGGTFLVTLPHHSVASEDIPDEITRTIDIDQTEDCTGGGTVQFFGTLELTANTTSASGNVAGDYSIIYTNCNEQILFEAADSRCSVETEVTGTLNNSLSIDFYSLDPFGSQNRTEINNTVVSNAPLEFVVASGSAQNVSYSYDFFSHTQAENDTYDGSLTFGGLQYDMTDVRDFIGTATSASICP